MSLTPLGAYSVGTRIPGSLVPLDQAALSIGETEKGKYIDTDGIPDPREAVETLIEGLRDRGVETVWAGADAETIKIQIAGSPIAWAVLIPFIPTILSVIGIVITFIAVYMIVGGIPSWAWGLLAVGLLFLTVIPTLIKLPAERRY